MIDKSNNNKEKMKKDSFRMDGHKLYWHLDRVKAWQEGERIFPLHIDVGLSKGCNIHCEYCYGVTQRNHYNKGINDFFPREPLLEYMKSAGECGVRSMALIGEAEPLINPHVYDAIETGATAGIDMALGTNGTLFDTGSDGHRALEHLTWIRFNLSAATKESYRKVHNSDLFNEVIGRMRYCVEIKNRYKLPVTLGIQMVLTPSNVDEVVDLAALGRNIGMDYFVVKHCSDTQKGDLGIYNQLDRYSEFKEILCKAEEESKENYKVIVKWQKINNKGQRNYNHCLGAPFLLYSSGDGKLYSCGMFFDYNEESYRLGDLTKQSFRQIIESDHYWNIMEAVKKIDVHKECYSNCRTHSINEFAWQLQNPPNHVNFI